MSQLARDTGLTREGLYKALSPEGNPTFSTVAKAVLLSVSNENDLESILLTHSPKFQSILNSSKKQIQDGKSIKHETFWEEIDN